MNRNCRANANPDQADPDGDSAGDACDPDDENDGVANANDNCRVTANPDHADLDRDGTGDVCDSDDDNDGVGDGNDACPRVAASTSNGCTPPVVVTPPADTLTSATVKSCRRSGRARKTRVICSLTRFGAVSRVTVKVTRRGRTVASGSARPAGSGTVTIRGTRTLRRGTCRVTLTLRDASGKTRKLTKSLRVH